MTVVSYHQHPTALGKLYFAFEMFRWTIHVIIQRYFNSDLLRLHRMMVESFISTQKYSVHKVMKERFRRYLADKSDYHSILLHLLRQLLREEQRNQQVRGWG